MKYVLIKNKIYGTNKQNLNNLELSSMAKDNSSLNVILIDFFVLFEFKTQDNITTKREPINAYINIQLYSCTF